MYHVSVNFIFVNETGNMPRRARVCVDFSPALDKNHCHSCTPPCREEIAASIE
jgi:hypothetical protein